MKEYITIEILKNILRADSKGRFIKRENQELEFKESFNFAAIADYLKYFASFSNNRGGYIVFGVKDKPHRFTGLSSESKDQMLKLDGEKITGYILEYFSGDIDFEYSVIDIDDKSLGVIYIKESKNKPIICKKNAGDVLKDGDIYYRYYSRAERIKYPELINIINKNVDSVNKDWHSLLSKIAKVGVENAAILDVSNGCIEKNDNKVIVDESSLDKIKWIKEGEFDEKKGAIALKLVGTAETTNIVEIEKAEPGDIFKLYPLTATALADKVIAKEPKITKNRKYYDLFSKYEIKSDKNYSFYNFRNKEQKDLYLKDGTLPQSIPSLYKEEAVDYIIELYNKEYLVTS
tara:strand:+ start:1797 stop:2837 length:1041 start_codon:yes stop_codon:yes gene_type:complete